MIPPRRSSFTGAVYFARSNFGRDQPIRDRRAMALLAFSHSPIGHRPYRLMLAETTAAHTGRGTLTIRQLMPFTGWNGHRSIRRARRGLVNKPSIEPRAIVDSNDLTRRPQIVHSIFTPGDTFARRRAAGLKPPLEDVQAYGSSTVSDLVIGPLVERHDLSRHEAQIAECYAEGRTNAQIGERLFIPEQTVKFHSRHTLIKFNMKRRTELIARPLTQSGTGEVRSW